MIKSKIKLFINYYINKKYDNYVLNKNLLLYTTYYNEFYK